MKKYIKLTILIILYPFFLLIRIPLYIIYRVLWHNTRSISNITKHYFDLDKEKRQREIEKQIREWIKGTPFELTELSIDWEEIIIN